MKHLRKLGWLLLRGLWTSTSYRLALALGILSGFLSLLQFALMGRFLQAGNSFPGIDAYGGNIMTYLLTGSVFTSFVGVSLSGFSGALRSEQSMGTLEALLISKTPLTHLMAYAGVASLISTVISSGIVLVILVILFGAPLSVNPLGVVITLAGLIFSLVGFGLASAGVLMVSKQGDPITWALTTLTSLVSGVLYPVAILPGWVQTVSWTLPTTQALHALRLSLTQSAGPAQLTGALIPLGIWGMVTIPAGLILLRWGLSKARRQGSLGEF